MVLSTQSAGGGLNGFTTTTAFGTARDSHGTALYNGYLYVLGGFDGANRLGDVQLAPINANGTVGAWTSTTPLPSARSGPLDAAPRR